MSTLLVTPALEEMREIWWHAYPPLNRITAVSVDKATKSSLVINGRRRSRVTDHEAYLPSLEDARAWLIEYHELKVGKAASMLAVRERDLERARNPQIKTQDTSEHVRAIK
jgi:hypothetical protein